MFTNFTNKEKKLLAHQERQILKSTRIKLSHLTISIALIGLLGGVNSFLFAQETTTETPAETSTKPSVSDGEVIDIGGEQINIDDKLLDDNFYFDLDENLNSGVPPETTTNSPAPTTNKTASNPPQKENKNYIQIQISNIVYPVTQEKENKYIYITNTFVKHLTNIVFKTNEVETVILNYKTNTVFKTNQIDGVTPDVYIDLGYEFVRVRRMISRRQYEQALLLLSQLEIASPNNSRVYNIRGSIYYKLGFYNYAISNWEKSLSINPNQYLVKRYIARLKVNPALQQGLKQPTR